MRIRLKQRSRAVVSVHIPKINPVIPKINPVIPKINPVIPKINPVIPKINPVARPWSYVGRHRSEGTAMTRAMHDRFAPRHCGGVTCLHDHPGEPMRPLFLPLGTAPMPTKEGR